MSRTLSCTASRARSCTPWGVQERAPKAQADTTNDTKPRKLSYKLQRELDALPERIAGLESSLRRKQLEIAEPQFYSQSHELVRDELAALARIQGELDEAMDRWLELEDMTTS